MKKILILCVVALLAACQSATPVAPVQATAPVPDTPVPQPTATDTETLAESDVLVKGIWYSADGMFIQFATGSVSDLKFTIYLISEGRDPWEKFGTGTADFENGKLTYLTAQGTCEDAQPAIYEYYIVKHEGKMIGMRQKLVGEDNCLDRKAATDGKFYKYIGQPSIFMPDNTEERLAKSGAELLGIWWFADNGIFLEIKGDVDLSTGSANLMHSLYTPWNDPWNKFATGTMKYEDGKLNYLTAKGSCDDAPQATYEIYMIVHDEKVIGMKPKLVGEDACAERKMVLDGKVVQRVRP